MSSFDPKHTEIREALKEDLAAAVKPIAAAIRSGDFRAIDLVHLVGEGKLIKNQGRAIATPEEVTALIEHKSPVKAAGSQKASNDDLPKSSISERQHTGKLHAKVHEESEEKAANDDELDHTGRESNRRANGHHGHAAQHS